MPTSPADLVRALDFLKAGRLRELCDALGVAPEDRRSKYALAEAIAGVPVARLAPVLETLKRDELKALCGALGLEDGGRDKRPMVERILGSAPAARGAAKAIQVALPLEPAAAPTPAPPAPSASRPRPRPAPPAPVPPAPPAARPAPARPRDDDDEPAPASLRYASGEKPSSRSVLAVLSRARLIEIARDVGASLDPSTSREAQIDALLAGGGVSFDRLMRTLGRDELRAACRAHRLDDSGRARAALAQRLLEAHGAHVTQPPRPLFRAHELPRYAPRAGDIVEVRHRQWLAEEVTPPPAEGHLTRARLVCLDDDNQGRVLEVLWELELGARVLQPEAHGLGEPRHVDPPRTFGAYLHALKWSSVTATDARLFQAPFRAGIKLLDHQLTPLKKALSLPRANLFIADDVGLGKTIEAGLVLQELLLRQRVELSLVVCPASVCLQWREEMQKKFGLHFEIMNRAFLARRRQERGFGVNPWSTHNRFIVSHQLVRRPEYRDPLLQHIGERAKKSLLILDEAHIAAPASASQYAVDSHITAVIRDLAPKFENRLFLSATPHNGHSNSFSALLEILDPQRFTRAVKVQPAHLEPVMVRRLKEDLRQAGSGEYPLRRVIRLDVGESDEAAPELALAEQLSAYTALMKPRKGRAKLVFINLQKRLLSSVEAFARTLRVHASSLQAPGASPQQELAGLPLRRAVDESELGEDDDVLDEEDAADVEAGSRLMDHPEAQAKSLLDELLRLAEQHRHQPDAKLRALVAWIQQHQCAGVDLAGGQRGARWTDRRVLIFTEYGDTKRYLLQLLGGAVDGTDRGDERILQIHGGMGEELREEVQRAFNSPPDAHPVRILIATDAAREGINLQGHCADLFHFDIPWNPARMEQRNGRIDRTLQPEKEVRCHYFHYPRRAEDVVLDKLVKKVETIQRELGSLSAVLMDRLEEALEDGISAKTAHRLDEAEALRARAETTRQELESQREQARLKKDSAENEAILQSSRRVMDFDPVLLREAIDVGLELAGAPKLQPGPAPGSLALPALPEAWQATLDTLRPTRGRDEPFWEWRKRPPLPVVLEPPPRMNSALVHLHLEHPLVQRILGRFLAQGYSAHDLSRVTVIKNKHDHIVRVLAFGRLSLFGHGATRLHDQLVSVAARWVDGASEPLRPFAEQADRGAVERLERLLAESPSLEGISEAVQAKVAAAAPALFGQLWPFVREEADARGKDAMDALARRGREEADALTAILARQLAAIEAELGKRQQRSFEELYDPREKRQHELDTEHLVERRFTLAAERDHEPDKLQRFYDVVRTRLEPVGLVCLWPGTKG